MGKVLLEIDDLADFTRYDWAILRGCFCGGGTRASSSSRAVSSSTTTTRNWANKQLSALHNTTARSASSKPFLLQKQGIIESRHTIMDRNDRFPMASREPNPLRPYYIPPSIGPAPSAIPANTSAQTSTMPRAPRPSSSYQSNATDLLPDLDLDFRSSAGEAWTNTRALLDTLAWRYASCLMAQPFDVAKTILQVSLPPNVAAASTPRKSKTSRRSSARSKEGSRRRDRAYESYSEKIGRASCRERV